MTEQTDKYVRNDSCTLIVAIFINCHLFYFITFQKGRFLAAIAAARNSLFRVIHYNLLKYNFMSISRSNAEFLAARAAAVVAGHKLSARQICRE